MESKEKSQLASDSENQQSEVKADNAVNDDGEADRPKSVKKKIDKKKQKKRASIRWAIMVIVITFFTSGLFSFASEYFIVNSSIYIAFIILFVLIAISIIFDMIGTAVTACSVDPFLAMATKRIKGAKKAVKLVKNASKVSSICNDIIGDICGIVSGAAGAAIIIKLAISTDTAQLIFSIVTSSIIAALTVGGKAIGKRFAVDKPQIIVFGVAKVLSIFSKD